MNLAFPSSNLYEEAKDFGAFLKERRLPMEKGEKYELKQKLISDLKYNGKYWNLDTL